MGLWKTNEVAVVFDACCGAPVPNPNRTALGR